MTARITKAIAVPITVAWLAALFAAGAALGHTTTWNGTCNDEELCVYQDQNLAGAWSATGNHIHVYAGQFLANNANGVNINNNVSSLQQRLTARDAYFYWEDEFTGNNFCYESWLIYNWVGFFHNDKYTSHNIMPNDSYC